ncbi:hypothetical protein Z043_114648 [Scleropages formosus]|uniref:Uncharacterized protein n=1 Tax=Scleropages formosus TaxID=113540 RepID=A0A0P7U9J6_SCLFO|nr:hypothetical protein Z043_114648 [Scleropages formosus]
MHLLTVCVSSLARSLPPSSGLRKSPELSPRRLSDISPQLRQLKFLAVEESIKEELKVSRSVEDINSVSIEERILRITGYYGYHPWNTLYTGTSASGKGGTQREAVEPASSVTILETLVLQPRNVSPSIEHEDKDFLLSSVSLPPHVPLCLSLSSCPSVSHPVLVSVRVSSHPHVPLCLSLSSSPSLCVCLLLSFHHPNTHPPVSPHLHVWYRRVWRVWDTDAAPQLPQV